MVLPLYLSTAILVLITMGSVIMSFAIFKTRRVIALLNRDNTDVDSSRQSDQSWHYLSILMMFFLGGYCLAVFLIAYEKFGWLPLLTGTVFFFGALFVLLSVSVYTRTLRQLMISQANYREESRRVASALLQLQQTQTLLVHNEKMLSLGQLSAGIAHEINNPVNFIHGNLQHIQNYTNDLFTLITAYNQVIGESKPAELLFLEANIELPFIKSDLAKILKSMKMGTQRIHKIVVSMRTFSRLDESQCKQANLTEGLDSGLVMLQSHLNQDSSATQYADINIVRDGTQLPLVECCHGAVNQVFLHLLTNAADAFATSVGRSAVPAEPPQIRVSTQQTDPHWIRIAIADNGSGIEPHNLAHIFNPFFTTKAVGQGTGLGLSISHQIIVEQHKGRLQCQSELGKGTKFVIDLPVHCGGKSLPISRH